MEIIKRVTPIIKHSQDTRETITENDLWGQWVETTSDGTIIIHDDLITNPNNNYRWDSRITKVEDNKIYKGDTLYANIQTDKIKEGRSMLFFYEDITSFNSDLSSLTNGYEMFYGCRNLGSFTSNLSSLTNSEYMFRDCENLTSFTTDLSSLTNSYGMFYQCENLSSFTSNLSSLINGSGMFYQCKNLTSFTSDVSSLTNGYCMFYECENLSSFTSNVSSLINGYGMFYRCSYLASFTSNLSSLACGGEMFHECTRLTKFNSDLSSLTNGSGMFFFCPNLTTFAGDLGGSPVNLSSLINGNSMFYYCIRLTDFNSDLSSLVNGNQMFLYCTNLRTFASDLSSLIAGKYMFERTKLTPQSVMFIADTIKDVDAEKQLYESGSIPYVTYDSVNKKYSATEGFMSNGTYVYTYHDYNPFTTTILAENVGKLTIGIDVSNNADTIQQQLEDFAKEATFDTWSDLKTHFSDKGWTVTFQYGGTDTSITYGLRDGEQIIPCPIFAKLIEDNKDSAQYCTEDASTFYNIEWGHDVTDTTDYTQFNSIEDAMTHWNVFPKENIITIEKDIITIEKEV